MGSFYTLSIVGLIFNGWFYFLCCFGWETKSKMYDLRKHNRLNRYASADANAECGRAAFGSCEPSSQDLHSSGAVYFKRTFVHPDQRFALQLEKSSASLCHKTRPIQSATVLGIKKMNCLSRLITKWALFLYIAAIFSMCTNIKSVIFRNVFIHVRNILLVANISKRYVIVSLVDFFYLCASIHSCIWKCQVYKQKQ